MMAFIFKTPGVLGGEASSECSGVEVGQGRGLGALSRRTWEASEASSWHPGPVAPCRVTSQAPAQGTRLFFGCSVVVVDFTFQRSSYCEHYLSRRIIVCDTVSVQESTHQSK